MSKSIDNNDIPLVVDLDGTLIYGDITQELILKHILKHPFRGVFDILRMYFSGKPKMKEELTHLHVDQLNINEYPLSILEKHEIINEATQKIIVTGSHQIIADKFLSQLKGFDSAYGTSKDINLTGQNKADFLKKKFPDGFRYIGNEHVDIHVWKEAEKAIGNNVSNSTIKAANDAGINLEIIERKSSPIKALLKEMRMHQWAKNVLLFIPALLSISQTELFDVLHLCIGFLTFGFIASATYILNDLLDLTADRSHSKKVNRPLASGKLSIFSALIVMFILFCLSIGGAYILQPIFAGLLITYAGISMVYSVLLKKIAVIDVITLSGLFCGRVLAGALLIESPINIWFMLCMFFFFLSLSLGKRTIEIMGLTNVKKIAGRGYQIEDKGFVITSGISSGFLSIAIVLIYFLLSKSESIETPIGAVAVVVLIVTWLLRFWLLIGRNELYHDPVTYAISDKASLSLLGLIGIVIITEQAMRIIL